MKEIALEELLEAGCHFGHQVIRSNPKARDYIFEARDNIHIIDLGKTKEGLDEAAEFVKNLAAKVNSTIIIVGTKRQAQGIVAEEVRKARETLKKDGLNTPENLFYVTVRWIGGILTNISEINKNFKKLKDLTEKLKDDEEKAKYTKKEVGLWDKERQRLENLYGGIGTMTKAPDALFIIDSHLEHLAVKEAIRMRVPTVAIVDTNADPNIIDYPIPANDDAVGSIKLIASYIIDAWVEGKKEQRSKSKDQKAEKEAKNENEEVKKVEKEEKKVETKEVKKIEAKPKEKAKTARVVKKETKKK